MTGISARFGHRVRMLREQHQWSLRQASAKTGASVSYLAKIERCEVHVTLDMADRIAAGFGIPLAELIAPIRCERCLDAPPAGFTCRACGTDGADTHGLADEAARKNWRPS